MPKPTTKIQSKKKVPLRLPIAKARKPKPKTTPSGVTSRVSRPLSLSVLDRYRLACINPFDPGAQGVQAPDEYPCSGVIRSHVRFRASLKSDSTGLLAVSFFPSPCLNMVFTAGTIATNLVYNNGINGTIQAGCLDSVLASNFRVWRPVCGGIQIRNNQPFNTIIGAATAATVPATCEYNINQSVLNYLGTTGNNDTITVLNSILGSTDVPSANMAALYGAKTGNCDQLIDKSLLLRMIPCGSSAHTWRNTNQSLGGNASYSISNTETVLISDGNTTGQSPSQSMDVRDFSIPLLYMDGLPVSSPVVTIDYILHFEGRSAVTTTLSSYASLQQSAIRDEAFPPQAVNGFLAKLPQIAMAACEFGSEFSSSLGLLAKMVKGI